MGGGDSQKLLPWRSLTPLWGAANLRRSTSTLSLQRPSGDGMSRACDSSLGRMCTRNMLVAGCVPVIRSATKSLQNPTVLRGSPAAAFLPQRPKLALQAAQFRDALFHVTDMDFQKRVDLTTVFFRCGANSEQNPDFVQRHVKGTAMANERQLFDVLLPITSKIPTRPPGFRQQSFMLVIPNSLDSASRCPCKFADCHLFRPSCFFSLIL